MTAVKVVAVSCIVAVSSVAAARVRATHCFDAEVVAAVTVLLHYAL